MSSAKSKSRYRQTLSTAIACGICLAHVHGADTSENDSEEEVALFLQSVKSPEPAKDEGPDTGAFFAKIIEARKEIEFLASHKRFEDLLVATKGLSSSLIEASQRLTTDDPRRAARFTAASKSLDNLAKAVHTFMWNGEERSLFEAAGKLESLAAHIESLIRPEERAEARKFLELAKG